MRREVSHENEQRRDYILILITIEDDLKFLHSLL